MRLHIYVPAAHHDGGLAGIAEFSGQGRGDAYRTTAFNDELFRDCLLYTSDAADE